MAPEGMNSPRIRARAAKLLELTTRAARGHYRVDGHAGTAQCIVALAFGYRFRAGARGPGLCNEYLASLVLTTSNGRPIVAQAEIDQAIRSLRPDMGADHVICSAQDPERYLDTYELAIQVRSIMGDYGWETAELIAHPHHLPRAQAVFASLGIETRTSAGVRSIWDRQSSQPWTRSPLRWAIRELVVICLYERRGWLHNAPGLR